MHMVKKYLFVFAVCIALVARVYAEYRPMVRTTSFRSTSAMLQSANSSGSTFPTTPSVFGTAYRPMPSYHRMATTSYRPYGTMVNAGGGTTGGYTPGDGYDPAPRGPRRSPVWDPELEEWVDDGTEPKENDRAFINGQWCIWNGTEWVPDESLIPTEMVPVGNMPWVLMLCLAMIYMLVVKYKKNRYEI